MAEISGNISGLQWLNPSGTPIDALLKGAQVGNIIADNMRQRQALGMQAAMLPSRLQALATHNKVQEAQLAEQWIKNAETMAEREAWQQDLVSTEPFMTETDPDKLSAMPVPAARTAKMQTAVHNRALMASQHLTVKARTGQYTELNKQAAEVFDGGETLTPIKDPFGITTFDSNEIAAKKTIIAERIQAGKIELKKTAADKAQSEVTARTRDQWIANKASKLQKDKGWSAEEAFTQARLEREVAEGKTEPAVLSQEDRRRVAAKRIPEIDAELGALTASTSWFGKEKRAARIVELRAERNKHLGQGGSTGVYDPSTGKIIRHNAP